MEKDEEPKSSENAVTDADTKEADNPLPPATDADGDVTTETESSLTDGVDIAARYQSLKEKEMLRLSKQMEERNSVDAKKKKRNRIIKTVLMVALIALSIGIMFGIGKYVGGDETKSFVDMVKGINPYFFLAFVGTFLFYIFVESLKFAYLLKISTGKFHLGYAFKTMLVGKYYDGITPLGTGGQPFQIYYLHKRKIPAGAATAIPLVKYIVTTFVLGIISIVLISVSPHFFRAEGVNHALWVTFIAVAFVSLAANMLIPIVMIFVSAFPRAGKKLIAGIIHFLSKIKIVRHKYRVMKKYVHEVNEYRGAMKLLITKWWRLIPIVLISILTVAAYFTLPFFSVVSIAGVTPTWHLLLQIWCFASVSFYSASLVPTPGSSGASEAASSIVFSTIAGITPVVGWVTLAWRFSTFYFFILAGVIMSIGTMIADAVRAKRAKRN